MLEKIKKLFSFFQYNKKILLKIEMIPYSNSNDGIYILANDIVYEFVSDYEIWTPKYNTIFLIN